MKLDCIFLTDELFLAYQSRSLEDISPDEVESHLQDCLICREKYSHLLSLYSTVKRAFSPDFLQNKQVEEGVVSALLAQFSLSCLDLTEERLLDYLTEDLPEFQKNQTLQHLQSCPTCGNSHEGALETLEKIRSTFVLDERDSSGRIPMEIWKKAFPSPYPLFRVAAAVLLFLGMGILCYSLFFTSKEPVKRPSDSAALGPLKKGSPVIGQDKKDPKGVERKIPKKAEKIALVHKKDSPDLPEKVKETPHLPKIPKVDVVRVVERVSPKRVQKKSPPVNLQKPRISPAKKNPLSPVAKAIRVAKGSKILKNSPLAKKEDPKELAKGLPKKEKEKVREKEEEKTPVVESVKILVQKPLLLGDINGDGKVDISDTMLLSRQLIGSSAKERRSKRKSKKLLFAVADFNKDGKINVVDVMILTKSVLKQ